MKQKIQHYFHETTVKRFENVSIEIDWYAVFDLEPYFIYLKSQQMEIFLILNSFDLQCALIAIMKTAIEIQYLFIQKHSTECKKCAPKN